MDHLKRRDRHGDWRSGLVNPLTGESREMLRVQELEIEVARLNAELETLRGEGETTDIAARFLTLAADTVNAALQQARREADELAAEVSAAAEARRDEATRLAEEAEARTEALRAEAADHETAIERAQLAAAAITEQAQTEAKELIATERGRLSEELERLGSVRGSLEQERQALENYHAELKRRVQELAESMVAFMTTEAPIVGNHEFDGEPSLGLAESAVEDEPDLEQEDSTGDDSAPLNPFINPATFASSAPTAEGDEVTPPPALSVDEVDVPPEPPAAEESLIEDSAPEDSEPKDAVSEDSVSEEAQPVGDSEEPTRRPRGFGLFSRAGEVADDSGADFAEPVEDSSDSPTELFGPDGARLIEQTSPDQLAAALDDEGEEDERFRSFIDGDGDEDASRDWLLRSEKS